MTSYISLLNKIEAFCNAHLQIKKYKGEFREQMPNFATTDEKYPVVFVVPTSDTETLELNQFTLDIYCVDIIQKDRANLNTIVSDCHLILKDLYLYFKDGSDLSVDVLTDPTMTPLNNFDLDYVAGWVMSITFEVEGYSVCAIPMNPIPPFTPSCEDATYEITDTDENILYSGSIVSGGELNQTIQDSTAVLKDTDGNVLSTTSILAEGSEDIVAPDAVVNFQYEDGTPIQTVNYLSGSTQDLPLSNAYAENSDSSYTASEPYGTTIQLPDITVTDSNGSTYTQPSVTDVFCTPCEGVDVYVGEANVGTFPSGSDVFVKVIQDGLEVIPEDITVVDDEVSIILADVPPCPDTNIEVNGVSEGSVPSGSTIDVQLSDSGGTVTPDSVTLVGTDLQIVLPDAVAPTPVGATLMKTGQTTSYRTGDDGDIEAGRATNFLTLDSSPLHNNGTATLNTTTNRFTDTLGGQTYANNIVLDWSTWNGSTLLGYDRTDRSGLSTNDSIDACLLLSVGGFIGYRLVNFNELCNLWNKGRTSVIDYPPFNHSTGFRRYLSSTTVPSATSTVYILQQAGVTPTTHGKTSGSAFDIHIAVRTFSLSTSNVLS